VAAIRTGTLCRDRKWSLLGPRKACLCSCWAIRAGMRRQNKILYGTVATCFSFPSSSDFGYMCKAYEWRGYWITYVMFISVFTGVPWVGRLVSCWSPQRPGFNVRVSYVVQKVAVIQVFLRILRFFLVSFHQLPIYYRCRIISVFDSIVK
jgi:hypothetical protein